MAKDDRIAYGVGRNRRHLTEREERQIIQAYKNNRTAAGTAKAFDGKYPYVTISKVLEKNKSLLDKLT